MKTRSYYGCENAASATAKLVIVDRNGNGFTDFYGESEALLDKLKLYRKLLDGDWKYEIYLRDVNFETGRLGGWTVAEIGTKDKVIF